MSSIHGKRLFTIPAIISVLAGFFISVLPLPAEENLQTNHQELARLIYQGKFEQARKILLNHPADLVNQPNDPLMSQLSKYLKLSSQRQKARSELYEKYIKEAKSYLAKSKLTVSSKPASTKPAKTEPEPKRDIEKALTASRKAKYYSLDQKQFGQIDFVREIAAKAKIEAAKYLSKHEWLKAGNIYAELATIYEDDKTYDKLTRDCVLRVRLEAVYKPKSDWQEQIKNIKIDIISELCYHVANFYVEKPDFAKMILSGLQSVSMITETPKITKVFPTLADKKKTSQFDLALKRLIDQVSTEKNSKELSTRELLQAFVRLIVINEETINIPQEMIVKEFIEAALSELDPFTNLIWPSEVDDFDKQTMGRFGGVGIHLTMENNKLNVFSPIPGTPAYHAGIMPGDHIAEINAESTESISIDQAVRKITGPKGTKVVLGIKAARFDKIHNFNLIRDIIIIHTVKGYKLDKDNDWNYFMDPPNDKIAYIRLTSFTDSTVSELIDALKQIRKEGAKGLIMDLRVNPGGTLKAAVETVELFIKKGIIVSTKGRNIKEEEKSASTGGKYADLPMIILINNLSASGAEIVSGALSDYHRAWIVGERSFGKGSVQNVWPFTNNPAKLKITTAYYYLPKGKCIHKKPESKEWGVDPNLKIELTPPELTNLITMQRDSEVVKQVNGLKVKSPTQTSTSSKPATRKSDEDDSGKDDSLQFPQEDVQLQAAATVMQARLLWNFQWDIAMIDSKSSENIMVKTSQ